MKKKMKTRMTKLYKSIDVDEVDKLRYLDCKHYEKCLNKAFKRNWISFSCSRCPEFRNFLKTKKEENFFFFRGLNNVY